MWVKTKKKKMSSAGLSVPSFISQKVLDELFSDFPFSPKDLFIVSYPKSGTTWMQHIVNLLSAGQLVEGRIVCDSNLSDAVPFLEKIGRQAALERLSPRYFHTHLPYNLMPGGGAPAQTLSKYIYITRNPKDVAVSYYYHNKRFEFSDFSGDWDDFFEYFLKGDVNYGSWFDHVLGWWSHKDAENILFLRYEDMKRDLPGAVRSISQFMGYDLDQATIESIAEQSSFESMKANPLANPDLFFTYKVETNSTPFLRKGVVDDWKSHFSEEQSSRFNAEYTKRMGGIGLKYCS